MVSGRLYEVFFLCADGSEPLDNYLSLESLGVGFRPGTSRYLCSTHCKDLPRAMHSVDRQNRLYDRA